MIVTEKVKMSVILVHFLCIFLFSTTAFSEPVCSKFAYEEQLLEKMVRMEFNVEQMEKEIKNTNNLVQESLQQLKQNWERVTREYEEMKTETKNVIDENKDKISAELEEMRKNRQKFLEEADNKMKELEGAVSVPNIAFKAKTPSLLDPVDHQVIVFTKTIVNTGNAYSNVTGMFTAPIDGTYLFTCQLCLVSKQSITFGIYIENILYTVGRFYEESAYNCFNIETTAAMTAGETASVKSWSASSGNVLYEDDIHRWSMFSGTLVHK